MMNFFELSVEQIVSTGLLKELGVKDADSMTTTRKLSEALFKLKTLFSNAENPQQLLQAIQKKLRNLEAEYEDDQYYRILLNCMQQALCATNAIHLSPEPKVYPFRKTAIQKLAGLFTYLMRQLSDEVESCAEQTAVEPETTASTSAGLKTGYRHKRKEPEPFDGLEDLEGLETKKIHAEVEGYQNSCARETAPVILITPPALVFSLPPTPTRTEALRARNRIRAQLIRKNLSIKK